MRPKDRAHGDWSSNIAMQLAKKAGMKPRDLAQLFAAKLSDAEGIASVEVAGPGFINITSRLRFGCGCGRHGLEQGAQYGRNDHLSGKTLNLEFVSANPTGPIHIGGVRWAGHRRLHGQSFGSQRREGRARILFQRPRRADQPLRQVPARCGARRGNAG
jgi:arginyl-tRNA synthetase